MIFVNLRLLRTGRLRIKFTYLLLHITTSTQSEVFRHEYFEILEVLEKYFIHLKKIASR